MLLNNDMEVDPHFLRPLLDGFRDESVFAVSSQDFFQDKPRWRQGFPEPYHDEVPRGPAGACLPVFWAGAGSSGPQMAFRPRGARLEDAHNPISPIGSTGSVAPRLIASDSGLILG